MHSLLNRARTRRVASWARGEAGDTMIEVVIAILIVGLLAAATFAGFSSVADISAQQRHEAQANQLAQQDEDRMRGLSPLELAASYSGCVSGTSNTTWELYGNQCHTTTIDGTAYTITSSTSYVAQAGGGASCAQGGSTSTADYIATASQVQWTGKNGQTNNGVTPIVEHSLISPSAGGSIITYAQGNTSSSGVAGVQFTVQGPSPSTATGVLATDSNGCAVFGGLSAGSYTVQMSDSRYITYNGVTTQNPTLVVGGTQQAKFIVGMPAAITANFQTILNGTPITNLPWDTFSISGGNVTPEPGPFGTVGTPGTSVTTPQTLYPTAYSAYAGTCSNDDPGGSTGTSGATGTSGSYVDPSVNVPSGATGNVTVTVPSMLLSLATTSPGGNTEYDDHGTAAISYSGAWTYSGLNYSPGDYGTDETWSNTSGNTATFTFTGTGIQWIGSLAGNHGYADVYLDGTKVATNVNTYASSSSAQQVLFSRSGLANTSHTIQINVDGTHPSGSSGNFVSIDAFIVTVPSSTTPVSVTPTLPYTVKTYDSCSTAVGRTLPTSGPGAPTAATVSGYSSPVYAIAAPYGTSVQACFANTVSGTTTNTGALPSTSPQLSNTNLNGTTVQTLTLPTATGATGASAVFSNSGACP